MSIWAHISPLITADSLAGFGLGATLSGAFFLAFTAERGPRRRQAAAGIRDVPVSARNTEAGASSAETEAVDAGLCGVAAFGAEAEAGAEAEWVEQLRSRAEDDQPRPGVQDEVSGTSPAGRDARPAAYRSRHRLLDPIPGRGARHRSPVGHTPRSGAFAPGDVAFPDGTFRSSRRPEVRRLPRHAAPAVSFGTRVSGRVTGH
jgi:hypothetical protein